MLTILNAVNLSAEYLEKKGIEDPKRNAELLLCKILNCNRLFLYLNFDRPLTEDETNTYRELIKRRAAREPLQYITGKVEFYGLELIVNNSVLIPRPETEILVEIIIKENKETGKKILDIGTGSGNIAIALAVNLPDAEITSIDKCSDALSVAEQNSILNNCKDRIRFLHKDIFADIPADREYDIIVSNPPYVSKTDFDDLQPELRIYEPRTALSDESDGLSFYKRIIEMSGELLADKGKIYFEMGQGQCLKVKELLLEYGYSDLKVTKDYQKIERVISGEKN